MTLASQVKPGDKIVLRDGKSIVTVTKIEPISNVVEGKHSFVALYWEFEGQRRYMTYVPDDEIEVRP